MSNIQQAENLKQIVKLVQPQFEELARIHGAVSYKKEASFALQALQGNSFLEDAAIANQDSLKAAIINVAAVGLSLSPITKLAYLIPRDKKIVLEISYRGYVQLAVDAGAVKWVHAEIVYEKDEFQLRGLGVEPSHKFSPFADRGKAIGAYCVAKTHGGDHITTIMTIDDIYDIRDRSQSWKSGKNSPWKSDPAEMIKKTVIRRGYKSWPMTDTRAQRFEQAIDVSNDADPVEFEALPAPEVASERSNHLSGIREALGYLERTEEKYIAHLATVNRRDIKALDDLTDLEISQAKVQLKQWTEQRRVKLEKESKNENASAN